MRLVGRRARAPAAAVLPLLPAGAAVTLEALAGGGRSRRHRGRLTAMSWQRPFKERNPIVEALMVKVLEEGKGAGQSPEWQTLGSVTRLDCHNPLCQRGGVDLHHTLREMVATRRAELEDVKMCGGMEGGGPGAGPRHCLNRFAFRISLTYKAESDR